MPSSSATSRGKIAIAAINDLVRRRQTSLGLAWRRRPRTSPFIAKVTAPGRRHRCAGPQIRPSRRSAHPGLPARRTRRSSARWSKRALSSTDRSRPSGPAVRDRVARIVRGQILPARWPRSSIGRDIMRTRAPDRRSARACCRARPTARLFFTRGEYAVRSSAATSASARDAQRIDALAGRVHRPVRRWASANMRRPSRSWRRAASAARKRREISHRAAGAQLAAALRERGRLPAHASAWCRDHRGSNGALSSMALGVAAVWR